MSLVKWIKAEWNRQPVTLVDGYQPKGNSGPPKVLPRAKSAVVPKRWEMT